MVYKTAPAKRLVKVQPYSAQMGLWALRHLSLVDKIQQSTGTKIFHLLLL